MPANFTPLDPALLPVSIHYHPETEPVGSTESLALHEVREHKVDDEEVVPYLSSRPETIKETEELKKVEAETLPSTKFPSYDEIKLPISDEKVEEGLQKPITSSWRWLAEFCRHILKHAHLALKKIHGKIVRVKIKQK